MRACHERDQVDEREIGRPQAGHPDRAHLEADTKDVDPTVQKPCNDTGRVPRPSQPVTNLWIHEIFEGEGNDLVPTKQKPLAKVHENEEKQHAAQPDRIGLSNIHIER